MKNIEDYGRFQDFRISAFQRFSFRFPLCGQACARLRKPMQAKSFSPSRIYSAPVEIPLRTAHFSFQVSAFRFQLSKLPIFKAFQNLSKQKTTPGPVSTVPLQDPNLDRRLLYP
jgi:hypothetical protein